VQALGRIGPEARSAASTLAGLAEDRGDPGLRVAAALALWRVEAEGTRRAAAARQAVAVCLSILETDEGRATPSSRTAALDLLRELGRDAEAAIPALVRRLDLGSAGEAARAADALGAIRGAASAARPALGKALLYAEAPEVRIAAARALWHIDRADGADAPAQEGALAVLSGALALRDRPARLLSVSALEEMGAQAKGAIPGLVRLLGDPSRDIRSAAGRAIRAIDPRAADEVRRARGGSKG
jgi:hypothetical protein